VSASNSDFAVGNFAAYRFNAAEVAPLVRPEAVGEAIERISFERSSFIPASMFEAGLNWER